MKVKEFLEKYKGLKWLELSGANGISCNKYRIGDYVISLIYNHGKNKIEVNKANFLETNFEKIIDMEYKFSHEIEPIIYLIIDFANKEVKV